jgi:phage terminase large subunit GpA-like protein
MTTPKIATRSIRCPKCGESHTVEHADWIDERGRMVSERDAVLCAHYRAEIAARSAQPFQLFRTPVATPAPKARRAAKKSA